MTIYTDEIKQLAKRADSLSRLDIADTSVTKSNPVCGDRITLDLHRQLPPLDKTDSTDSTDATIEIGMQVRGCLICKVAAAVVQQNCNHRTEGEIKLFAKELAAMLSHNVTQIAATSLHPDLRILQPVAEHKHRHSCVLLPARALLDALESTP